MAEVKEKNGNGSSFKWLRSTTNKIWNSLPFRLCLIALIILLLFSSIIYYIEKDHVSYRTVNGQLIPDPNSSSNIRSFEEALWWTIVTSTTVGYGDYYPKSRAGRLTGILLMFFGISLVGVVTGNIASFLVEKQLKEGRGLKQLKLTNHFIICGWKRNMAEVLTDILGKNKSFLPSELVVITTADPAEFENLRSDKTLATINFIHGDYIDERVLHRANLKHAQKVLVLADRMISGSAQEIDSRTVMTIITVKSLSKSVYTCAELLDSKFARYLSASNCDEVILSSNYNRALIANASTGSGISHVINELLDVNAGISINTLGIPKNFIGKTFRDLYDYYQNRDHSILIGILENTGNFFTRKKEAIHEAQKTPDISRLVDNLKDVKKLMPNLPVINPYPGYVLKKYSRAILIEGRSRHLAEAGASEVYHGSI
ncbi:MAG: NAD-binding protein [Spirochaetes bacterium]|nr:NAD-binding protein [Spirochaetota bacterium]